MKPFRLAEDVVCICMASDTDLIRAAPDGSGRRLKASPAMALSFAAHFAEPSTETLWLEHFDEGRRAEAKAIFDAARRNGFVQDAGAVPSAEQEPAALDDVAQSLCVLANRVRAELAMRSAPAAGEGAILIACHRLLQHLSEQLAGRHQEDVEATLATLRDAAPLRLHLGCGDMRLPGWINIDLLQGDLQLDLRRPLPFADQAVAAVFIGHVLEHLDYKEEALALLREVRRVLASDGIVRVIVPDIASFLHAYAEDDAAFFDRFTNLWQRPEEPTLLATFLHYAGAGRLPHVQDRHCYGYDAETLAALLIEAGFHLPERRVPGESRIADEQLDYSWAARATGGGRPYALIMEAQA